MFCLQFLAFAITGVCFIAIQANLIFYVAFFSVLFVLPFNLNWTLALSKTSLHSPINKICPKSTSITPQQYSSGKHSRYCNHMSSIVAVVYAIFGQLTTDLWKQCDVFHVINFHENCTLKKRTLKKSVNLITSQRTRIFASIMRYCDSGICLYTFK